MFLPQGNLQYQAGVLNEAKSNYLATHLEVQNQHVFFPSPFKQKNPANVATGYQKLHAIVKDLEVYFPPRLPSPNSRTMYYILYIYISYILAVYIYIRITYMNIKIYFCLGGCRIDLLVNLP